MDDNTSKEESQEIVKIRDELKSMQENDEKQEQLAQERYRREVRKERKRLKEEREAKGIHCNPGVKEVRDAVESINKKERRFLLQRQLDQLDKEEGNIKKRIDDKYGVLFSKDKEKPDLTKLADDFFCLPSDSNLPREVTDKLTHQEISDLREVFDMFDVKGKG